MKTTVGRHLGNSTVWAGLAITLAAGIIHDDNALPATVWPNEPAGFNLVTDWDWSALNGGGWTTTFIVDTLVTSDGTAPLSPPLVIQDRFIDANDIGGGAKHYYSLPPNFNEGYIGVRWKISNPFLPYGSCFEKGFSTKGNGGAIWWSLNGCSENNMFLYVGLTMNNPPLFNCNFPGSWGDCPGTRNVPSNTGANTFFSAGTWHTVETYFKYSTCETCANGIVRVWLDGVQTHNLTTVNFMPLSDPFWELLITPAWGDGNSGTADKSHFWDHVHVSAPTGTGPPPDTAPPAPPSGLRVQ